MKKEHRHATIENIITQYQKYGKDDSHEILRAYDFAQKAHVGRVRFGGDLYIIHPVWVAHELMTLEPDVVTIVVALLHDTVSDWNASLDEIENNFWKDVRWMIESLDKIALVQYRWQEKSLDRLQRTLLAMTEDVRSIFVRFADRIDNLRHITQYGDTTMRKRLAEESLSLYAPIAARFGFYDYKETLETLSLKELDLEWYLHVTGELAHFTAEQEKFLTQSVEHILSILPEKYQNSVSYRIKKPYSIYRKLRQQWVKSIHDIYDIFAIRIIVEDVSDCYAVLGLIHGHFTPLSDRFKDFIAVPKRNGYQSLHTTVLGFEGYKQPVEIQIRTVSMDREAEHGTAAHVLYKTHGDTMKKNDPTEDIIQLTTDALMEQSGSLLGKKISTPTIFVFSPKGDVFELPQHATPVDFAYAVHSDVWYHTIGARIDGKIATLDTRLIDGNIVEIITNTQAHPVRQWMDFVVSSKAKSQISVEVKRLSGDRSTVVERWKKMLFDVFSAAGIALKEDLANFSPYYGSILDAKKTEELYYQIGQWMRKPSSFLPRKNKVKTGRPTIFSDPTRVIIWWEKQIPHTMAHCCSPVFPDDIVAVLRTGGKCMIHRADCGSLDRVNPRRILSTYWQTNEKGKIISFSLIFHDVPWLLSRITKVFYEMGANIIDMSITPLNISTMRMRARIEIQAQDISFFDRLLDRMKTSIPEYLYREEDFFDKEK